MIPTAFLRPWLLLWPVLLGLLGPARADDADDDPYRSGLVATFRDASGQTITRLDPRLSFAWGTARPDSRLSGGEWSATWKGLLRVEGRGNYRFSVFACGEVALRVAGRAVVVRRALPGDWYDAEPIALTPGQHALELTFRRTGPEARLAVFWSGPSFPREPVPPRLLSHPRDQAPGQEFERGQLLARVLRCGRCHADEPQPPSAPALDRLAGQMSRAWLVRWLTTHDSPASAPRRMPAFGLTTAQAEAIADELLATRSGAEPPRPVKPAPPPRPTTKPKKGPEKPAPTAAMGERLFVTRGCLACHTWRDLGASGWLGGGDLTHVADKRPPTFFATWLNEPARLNLDHRMPVFTLDADERTALCLFLAEQRSEKSPKAEAAAKASPEGRRLIEQFRCGSCHRLPGDEPKPIAVAPLGERSDWSRSCAGEPEPARQRPGYRLAAADAPALRIYYTQRRDRTAPLPGRLRLAEQNCFACHVREGAREAVPLLPPTLSDKLAAVDRRYTDLAPVVPALTPPALNSVGDKLTDTALAEAVRATRVHRPYLQVRMPRYPLDDAELTALVADLVAEDRVPPHGIAAPTPDKARRDRYALAGGRLVSSDGFGCTSCHAVGRVEPPEGPIGQRGPSLTDLGRRIRRPWFDRWLHDPARIVPRMEMPSVQIAIRGVLDDRLGEQINALWYVLNTPGFDPPPPNPIRILRHDGNQPQAEPVVITDLLHRGDTIDLRPFVIGLANRHNVLLDLESGRLALWTVGDTARQRTKGKTWFWELAGATVLDPGLAGPDLAPIVNGRPLAPVPQGQFLTEPERWFTDGTAFEVHYPLNYGDGHRLSVHRRLSPIADGFRQGLTVQMHGPTTPLRLRVLSSALAARATLSTDGRTLRLNDAFESRIVIAEPAGARFAPDGTAVVLTPDGSSAVRLVLDYRTRAPVDRLPPVPPTPTVIRKPEPVEIAPGFVGERLPLPADIMPTGLSWRPNGRLVFCSLKGQVYEAIDSDGDGCEDQLILLADGLPAPYGVAAAASYVDVAAKYALWRIRRHGPTRHGAALAASGWGYTSDYHDWAIGLPQNDQGHYFLGIPCQQDKRSPEAARYHGQVLRLVPRHPTLTDSRLFALEPISAGHRFPMGLALDRHGELFVTDNQGNYNPFNEINHVRKGAHFGFVNALDKGKPVPPLTAPAIDIPHPWTRSVNGIAFLDTPRPLRARLGRDAFGPFEGHLVGCEYDTRRLVRMTLQKVGDTYQGAAYPLSISPADPARGFLGPIVCAVSPQGALHVGSIRDSGWGAGNNVGELVRVRIEPEQLTCGIAEARATPHGFTIDFVRPVDRAAAARPDSYVIQSYRREATPAYGGPDLDRRTETIADVRVSDDGRRVALRLAELRPGFVYEFRLKNLAPGGAEFFPAEAYYTLRTVPRTPESDP